MNWTAARATTAIAVVTAVVSLILIVTGMVPDAAVAGGFIPLRFEGAEAIAPLAVEAAINYQSATFGISADTVSPWTISINNGLRVIGFYDGFFGPGTGSFLVFAWVRLLGYDFLNASASAKLINTATNFSALMLFAWQGHVWWHLALATGLNLLWAAAALLLFAGQFRAARTRGALLTIGE